MRNKLLYITVCLLLLSFAALGQSNVARIWGVPKKYWTNPDGSILANSREDAVKEAFWIVFSDRDGNTSFADNAGVTPLKKIAFLQRFYVTGESGNYLHLYKWAEGIKGNGNELLPDAEDYGWVDKSSLLLWDRCLEGETHKSIKAFLAKNSVGDNNKLKTFRQPNLSIANVAIPVHSALMFVYKQEGHSVLLGRGFQSGTSQIQDDILGWADKNTVQLWDGSTCLTLNYDPTAIDERKGAGVSAAIFPSEDVALQYKTTPVQVKDALWKEPSVYSGKPAFFPLLYTSNNIASAGYLANQRETANESGGQYPLWLDTTGKNIFLMEGYTASVVAGLKEPLFKKALYLHVSELIELIAQLNTLNFEGSNSENRQKIKDSYFEILKTFLGERNAHDIIVSGAITVDDVQFCITGIHSANTIFKHNISDFTKPDKISAEEIAKIRDYMLTKIQGLQALLTEDELAFKFDWGIYYLVPEDRLP